MEIANIIATNIQNLLDDRKVSVSEISNYLGISRQTMTNYLKAVSVIDSVQLVKIANYFSVPITDFYSDNSLDKKPEMIFRTALNYSVAIDEIQDNVYNLLEEYITLAKSCNKPLCYFPEQYNLTLISQGEAIDVNFECQNYFDSRLKIDNALRSEILKIANEQRSILGLGDRGAISLISALTRRGINVIFTDLGDNDIFGLSICEDTKGCFIFVNSNSKISIERQLFTLAHEYGHIVMHRPIFKRKLNHNTDISSATNLLDKMADCFAGYLLAPEQMLAPYAGSLTHIRNDLNAICRFLIPLKLKFQVSLYSLLISFKNFGYISSNVVSEYHKFITSHKIEKEEINPIKNHKELLNTFNYECATVTTEMIHKLYGSGILDIHESKNKLKLFGNRSDEEVDLIVSGWENTNKDINNILDFNLLLN